MKTALAIAVALFIAVLLFRFLRGVMLGRKLEGAAGDCDVDESASPELKRAVQEAVATGKPRDAVRQIERRAISGEAAVRAAYHCAAGNLVLKEMKRPGLAVGLYLRALRADPTCIGAFERLREILIAQKRLRRFERTCWDVLGRLDDGDVGSPMWTAAWSGLAAVYSTSPKHVRRADAIRKMLASLSSEDPEEISGATPR